MIDGKGFIPRNAVVQPVVTDPVTNAGAVKAGPVSLLAGPLMTRASPGSGPEASVDLRGRSAEIIHPDLAPRPRLDLPDMPVG